jgi:uncharacterized repeat protein (TIGR03806 family)
MRTLAVASVAVVLSLFVACGSDTAGAPPGGADGGAPGDPDGGSAPGADATADASLADTGVPPVPSPFGLDTRPSNTTCVAKARPPSDATIALEDAFPSLPNFNRPVWMMQAPGDKTKFYVVEQGTSTGTAQIRVFTNSPTVATTSPFLTLPAGTVVLGSAGEGGLLSFAFHPGWAANRTAFISYTYGTGTTITSSRVARIKSTDGGGTLDLATEEKTFLEIAQPFSNHNGGLVLFGPDGYLYMGFGDGGSSNDPNGNGQNTNVLLGKMLRVGAGPTGPYTIPADNPFAGGGGRPEIYAYGLRNPWRFSFDRLSGELWAGDVGQNAYEEIDLIQRGGNYGWKVREGAHCRPGGPATCPTAGLIDPIVEYPHTPGGQSITGGYVYQGSKIPELAGSYLFADYVKGTLYTIDWSTTPASPKVLLTAPFNISSFAEDADGELYVINYSGGRIMRVARSGPPPADTFPKQLSATGCVDPTDARKPASGLVPFAPVAQLWSDNADKSRWLAIPDGTRIARAADGDFDFPNGTVLVKEFRVAKKRIETRLFMRHDDGDWGGYSYEWNDAETDATLLPAGKTKPVTGQTWTYPDRVQCLGCHTAAAGRSLGLETGQLNNDFVYTATNRISNQLATLDHIGMFEAPIGKLSDHPSFPDPFGAAALPSRARAYLHANCAGCHRPAGTGRGPQNLLYGAAAADVQLCDVDPLEGDLGVAGAKLVFPGSPAKSVLSLRVRATDATRMPPLGTRIVHADAAALLDAWITATTTCP